MYKAARRCHTGQKLETPLSLFLVSVSLNTSTKDKSLPWRGLSALAVLLGRVWTGACYWHGAGGFMFNSSPSVLLGGE